MPSDTENSLNISDFWDLAAQRVCTSCREYTIHTDTCIENELFSFLGWNAAPKTASQVLIETRYS